MDEERLSGELGLESASAKLLGAAYHEDVGAALAFYPGQVGGRDRGLIVGAPGEGGAYVVPIETTGEVALAEVGTFLRGEETWSGRSVATAGDLNVDGYDDILISDAEAGAVFVFYGPISGAEQEYGAALRGAGGLYGPSSVASAGDVNGDGVVDVLVGAPHVCSGDAIGCSGVAYLFAGPVTGPLALEEAYEARLTTGIGGMTGQRVAGIGDSNGDGFADVVIGVPIDGSTGDLRCAAYVVHGPVSGSVNIATLAAGVVDDGDFFGLGSTVAAAGDVDGDGLADVLVGAGDANRGATYGSDGTGAVVVVAGPAETLIAAADAMAVLWGSAEGAAAGAALAGVDMDGDGAGDIIIGTPGLDERGRNSGGAVLVYGPVDGRLELSTQGAAFLLGEAAGDGAGGAVALLAGDGGQGPTRIAVGASSDDTADTRSGAAYLFQLE